VFPVLIPRYNKINGAPAPKVTKKVGIKFFKVVATLLLMNMKYETTIRSPSHSDVLVPDKNKETIEVKTIATPSFRFLFARLIKESPTAIQTKAAYDIANALNSNPVGRSATPVNTSRELS
jgi:hypothetical protein